MRRLTLVTALAALLAFPALALAHDGHRGDEGGNGKHGANAAQAGCRAERQQLGDDAFKSKYGTNRNKANAFGKCVSSGARAGKADKGLGRAGKRLAQLEFATGAISSFGAASCNTSTAGCVLTASGAIEGKPIAHGTWSASLTAVWTSATANGDGGYCAPTTGTVLLSDGTNSLTESVSGQLCEIGATGASVGHFFTGTVTVTSGAGSYANATGRAKLSFYQPTGSNAITAVQRGSIATP